MPEVNELLTLIKKNHPKLWKSVNLFVDRNFKIDHQQDYVRTSLYTVYIFLINPVAHQRVKLLSDFKRDYSDVDLIELILIERLGTNQGLVIKFGPNDKYYKYLDYKDSCCIKEKKHTVTDEWKIDQTYLSGLDFTDLPKKEGYIYLVKPVLSNGVYKIGYTMEENPMKRIKNGYLKGTELLYLSPKIKYPVKIEFELKKELNHSFKLVAGKEYFEGSISDMISLIQRKICSHFMKTIYDNYK